VLDLVADVLYEHLFGSSSDKAKGRDLIVEDRSFAGCESASRERRESFDGDSSRAKRRVRVDVGPELDEELRRRKVEMRRSQIHDRSETDETKRNKPSRHVEKM